VTRVWEISPFLFNPLWLFNNSWWFIGIWHLHEVKVQFYFWPSLWGIANSLRNAYSIGQEIPHLVRLPKFCTNSQDSLIGSRDEPIKSNIQPHTLFTYNRFQYYM
jgi:hypothetical protein